MAKSRGLAKKTHAVEAQSADKFASLGKRKLIGQVLAARSHNDILVLTPRGTISRVSLKTALPPKAGDFIEAVGSVETDTYFLNLTRARWRKAEPFDTAAPPPMEMTAREIMTQADGQLLISTRLHGQTVRIRSAVRSIPDPAGMGHRRTACAPCWLPRLESRPQPCGKEDGA